MIWRDGALPPGVPPFAETLSDDLLDYGHTVMAMALRLRRLSRDSAILGRAFLVAGEAIEAVVHRGASDHERGFHRVTAAVAFHLGRYAARAYSVLPAGVHVENLSPAEEAIVHLIRRRLEELHRSFSSWLLNADHDDETIASKLLRQDDFDQNAAVHEILTGSFMRGLALFDHAIATGNSDSAEASKQRLIATADGARDLNAVSHWWTATMASHLVEELWELSFHAQIPELPPDDDDHELWHQIRRGYIQRLRAGDRAAIELWPSQMAAARRALDPSDDLVVALPTSAGKTRIAEMCILRTLASDRRVVYITPLRALSAQIERDLGDSLQPLGFSVSSLYGSAGIARGDEETLRDGRIVVSTPEKLDFALRNDPSIIDDVGLIVLDEGHMLGPGEREVRYEALVQRLVRRGDAGNRRIVCLSALFPTPELMGDLVAWLRMDQPGVPVHSTWRPTRQRFGVLRWGTDAARLDVKVEDETPFVPRFIEEQLPPWKFKSAGKGKRSKAFPADKNELTLAAAWRFIEQEKDVLIYCAIRSSVETLGRLALQCIGHGVLPPVRDTNPRIRDAMATGAEWLGADHPAVACLEFGIALHHGGLPRPFLNEVERLLRTGACPVTIASPTLAQGLNLSASVLLVPSIWRNKEIIPAPEFANVAGRAGRAFVDLEGLVLHVAWRDTPLKTDKAVRDWQKLVAAARAPEVTSGILRLAITIFNRIAKSAGVRTAEVIDYVTGHGNGWDFDGSRAENAAVDAATWARDIASLDAAILALLDGETADDQVAVALEDVLNGSLFSRQLAKREANVQQLLHRFVAARAQKIWSETVPAQRKGYHAAGIGLAAGGFIDASLSTLVSLLIKAENGITVGHDRVSAAAVVAFAELVFQTPPFQPPPPAELPENWKDALRAWICGRASSDVLAMCGGAADLIQEALAYRLPWAMEAVRVHALAVAHSDAATLTGVAALAVETGSTNVSVMTLIRAGLGSREAAATAVTSTNADFTDRTEMRIWLASPEVEARSLDENWPTPRTRHAWLRFSEGERTRDRRKWKREDQHIRVQWHAPTPAQGTAVIVESVSGRNGLVLTPDFKPLGELSSPMRRRRHDIVSALVSSNGDGVDLEFFGPRALG